MTESATFDSCSPADWPVVAAVARSYCRIRCSHCSDRTGPFAWGTVDNEEDHD